MFFKKGNGENTRNDELAKPIEILVSEEDKNGRDILSMSNFFDVAMRQMSNMFVTSKSDIDLSNISPFELRVVNDALQMIGAYYSPQYALIPDFASLPKHIKEKLKKGELILGESKQVQGNLRSVLIDAETNSRVKDITLKRIENTNQIEAISRDLLMQMELSKISNTLEKLESEQGYLIGLTRNEAIMRPFLDARDSLLAAQNAQNKKIQIEKLKKAEDKMNTAINAVYVDMATIEKEFARIAKKSWFKRTKKSNIDELMQRITEDLQVVTRYVGIQSQIYYYLGDESEQKRVLESFKRNINRFFEKGVVSSDKSLAIFIHENALYDDKNRDCWYRFEQDIKPLLDLTYDGIQTKEIYVITADGEK